MKTIDVKTWTGRSLFEQFGGLDIPFFSVTTQHDVTRLLRLSESRKIAFFSLCLYAVTRAVNRVEAFRFRALAGGEVVLHDRIDAVYLALRADRAITAVRVPYAEDFETFREARREAERAALAKKRPEFYDGPERDVIYVSCMPWLAFTSGSHPCSLGRDYDSIPRITFGKYDRQETRTTMPFDVHSHHGFVDGFRLGELLREFDGAPV